ncbi:MAG: hypothetical protein AABY53_05865 [Bdellovibrionota bacterium]
MKKTLLCLSILAVSQNIFAQPVGGFGGHGKNDSSVVERPYESVDLLTKTRAIVNDQIKTVSNEMLVDIQNDASLHCNSKRAVSILANVCSALPICNFMVDQAGSGATDRTALHNDTPKEVRAASGFFGGILTLVVLEIAAGVGGTVGHGAALYQNISSPMSSAGMYTRRDANNIYAAMLDEMPKAAFAGAIDISRSTENSMACIVLKASQEEVGRRARDTNSPDAPTGFEIR